MTFASLSDASPAFPRSPLVWASIISHRIIAYSFNPPPCSQPILVQSRLQKSSSICGFPLTPLDDNFLWQKGMSGCLVYASCITFLPHLCPTCCSQLPIPVSPSLPTVLVFFPPVCVYHRGCVVNNKVLKFVNFFLFN